LLVGLAPQQDPIAAKAAAPATPGPQVVVVAAFDTHASAAVSEVDAIASDPHLATHPEQTFTPGAKPIATSAVAATGPMLPFSTRQSPSS
jgi:hypothetical protein